MRRIDRQAGNPDERGTAMVAGLVTVMGLMGMTAAVLVLAMGSNKERGESMDVNLASMAARAGIADAFGRLHAGLEEDLGSGDTPVAFGSGGYWVDVTNNDNGTYTIAAVGQVRNVREGIEVIVQAETTDIYNAAMFAGNSSGDANYELRLGGTGGQADSVVGDIFSGGDVLLAGDSTVSGDITASGTITGADGEEGANKSIPDLFAMDYENTADFNVENLFSGATYTYDNAGGNAWQVPESNPAHVFRKNPSDRTTETSGTVKDDYFLEDPYENVSSNKFQVSLADDGNEAVYFIDGNLWIHNKNSYSMQLKHSSAHGALVTIVVKGNIYFSDDLVMTNINKDAIAFIAMEDDQVTDSGNIYFGDPVFGTLNQMEGFMYAQNNFYDLNLDASGSAEIEVYGNMTAGNQIVIDRDYEKVTSWWDWWTYSWQTSTTETHTQMKLEWDDRVSTGAITLPGLPTVSSSAGDSFRITAWRRIADDSVMEVMHGIDPYSGQDPTQGGDPGQHGY